MKPISTRSLRSLTLILSSAILIVAFNNCHFEAIAPIVAEPGSGIIPISQGTETGNPLDIPLSEASKAIIEATCDVVQAAHPELKRADCILGTVRTSFADGLGIPLHLYNPYRLLIADEILGKITANSTALKNCLSDIKSIDPRSDVATASFQAHDFNPFNELRAMIPSRDGGCPAIYSGNKFKAYVPRDTGSVVNSNTGITKTSLNFDSTDQLITQIQSGDDLTGRVIDVDFGNTGEWGWSKPFDADTTNNVFLKGSSGRLDFTAGARQIKSIDLYALETGTVTITDELGQTASAVIPADSSMHSISLNFSAPSSSLTITFTAKRKLGIDNLLYQYGTNSMDVYKDPPLPTL